jgi:hypothetical protein
MTLNNLAVLNKSRGRYAEAERLYRRAMAIMETALGPRHPKVITCRGNYGALLREMNSRHDTAKPSPRLNRAEIQTPDSRQRGSG